MGGGRSPPARWTRRCPCGRIFATTLPIGSTAALRSKRRWTTRGSLAMGKTSTSTIADSLTEEATGRTHRLGWPVFCFSVEDAPHLRQTVFGDVFALPPSSLRLALRSMTPRAAVSLALRASGESSACPHHRWFQ